MNPTLLPSNQEGLNASLTGQGTGKTNYAFVSFNNTTLFLIPPFGRWSNPSKVPAALFTRGRADTDPATAMAEQMPLSY